MASSSSSRKVIGGPVTVLSTESDSMTTFVRTDPSNFRAVVQLLTGNGKSISGEPSFKLHERRPAAGKLEINTNNPADNPAAIFSPVSPLERAAAPTKEAEKGFHLHPNPSVGSDPPELLPLFPLHSPVD